MFISRDVRFYEYFYPYKIFKSKHEPQTPLQLNNHVPDFTLDDYETLDNTTNYQPKLPLAQPTTQP